MLEVPQRMALYSSQCCKSKCHSLGHPCRLSQASTTLSPWPSMASPVRPVSTLGFPITMLIPSSGPLLSLPPQMLSLPDDQNHIHPSKHKGRPNFPLAAFPPLSSGDADGHPYLILLSFWGLPLAPCFLFQLLAGSSHAHISIPHRMPRLEQQ